MIEKICMALIFVGVAVGVGIYCRRHTGSVDGFILGGRNVGPWLSAFAFGTSYFSAVIFVGYAGQFGWKYGVAATWIGIGNAILGSLLAWWVLGPRTREMTHRLGASTMPEFFGARFQSKGLRIAAAAIIFVFLIPYTASVYNGLSRLFGMAFGLPYEVCVIGMAVITCVYVVLGGYMATVMNDFIQGIVMLLGIVAVIVAVLVNNGGFTEAIATLSLIPAEDSQMAGPFVSFFGPNLPDLIGVIVLTSLGTWGLPQMVQKFYAIKSGPAIKQGAIISTVFAMVVAGGSYFLGGFGRLYGDQVEMTAAGTPVYDSIMPTMLSTLPDLLIGIVIVLVLSASMSTLSSLVLTSSSTLTLDLLKDNVVKNMSEKKTAGVHARADRGVHRDLGGDRAGAVQLVHHVHRTADEHLVGRAGRFVLGTLLLGALLASRVASGCVGQLHRGRGSDYGQHDRRVRGHGVHRVAHQLRRHCDGAVADHRAGGQLVHKAR